jgi:hypothetical protein
MKRPSDLEREAEIRDAAHGRTGSRWASPDDDIWQSLRERRGMTTKSKKTYAKPAPTTAELLDRITLTNGSPLPTALQVSVLLEFLSLNQMVRGGLLGYVHNFQEMTVGKCTSPRNVMAAYRFAYSDDFGEGEDGDEAELALLLSFLDDVLGGNPEDDFGGFSFGDMLADYCEKILNKNRARPVLLKVEIARVDKEDMYRSVADQIRKAVRDCVTDLNKPAVKQSSPLPGQQVLPYNDEPEVRAPRFRAPARHKDWTGQTITYKSDSQQRVVGTVLSDIDGRIWFLDDQGKEWGDDVGVDKGRCTAVAPIDGAPVVSAAQQPDLVLALPEALMKEIKVGYRKAGRKSTLPGECVFTTAAALNDSVVVRLGLYKGYTAGDKPFFMLEAFAPARVNEIIGTAPPFFSPEGKHQLWVQSRYYLVELRVLDAVSD